ncbi:MAG: homoserine dehydrogenase [Desulfosalsimonadaceae bacterium]
MKQQIGIGILGLGTVGTGVARLLTENKDLIARRLGAELVIRRAADLDIEKDRGLNLAGGVLSTRASDVTEDPEVDIVIELIGGKSTALDLIHAAIAGGKHVVTANKALLAETGVSLFEKASAAGVTIAFEPSAGGCMPIVKTLRESLAGNRIYSICGILNGTCNYILTKITEEGATFADALAKAQELGYAEADPGLDVDGIDTAHKLALLSALAYGMDCSFSDIYMEGISGITPMDIEFAAQCGYRIKLLAITKYDEENDTVELRVHPTMIPEKNQLSKVDGTLNAVTITGDAVGEMMLYGHGAGMMPTASAVASDIIDIARSLISGGGARVPMLSFQMENIRRISVLPIEEIYTHYYFRLSALDRPGVLSKVAGILGEHGISIKSVHQIERKSNNGVPIFMLTHKAREADVKSALAKIAALNVVTNDPVLIRIEENQS